MDMRRQLSTTLLLLLVLSGCDASALPPRYRTLTVPEERLASTEARQQGRALFLAHCALCHGEHADGRGPRQNLSSKPQDLTDPAWQNRASPRWVYFVIREGKSGTAMAPNKILTLEETWDLVAYVLSLPEEAR